MRSSGVSVFSTPLPISRSAGAVVAEAVVAERVGVGEDELRAALQLEFLLALGQQEALLLAGRGSVDALRADRDLPELIAGACEQSGIG